MCTILLKDISTINIKILVQVTPEVLSTTEILSALNVKKLVVEQDRSRKREYPVRSCKFQKNCKLQVFIVQLQDAN